MFLIRALYDGESFMLAMCLGILRIILIYDIMTGIFTTLKAYMDRQEHEKAVKR